MDTYWDKDEEYPKRPWPALRSIGCHDFLGLQARNLDIVNSTLMYTAFIDPSIIVCVLMESQLISVFQSVARHAECHNF